MSTPFFGCLKLLPPGRRVKKNKYMYLHQEIKFRILKWIVRQKLKFSYLWFLYLLIEFLNIRFHGQKLFYICYMVSKKKVLALASLKLLHVSTWILPIKLFFTCSQKRHNFVEEWYSRCLFKIVFYDFLLRLDGTLMVHAKIEPIFSPFYEYLQKLECEHTLCIKKINLN